MHSGWNRFCRRAAVIAIALFLIMLVLGRLLRLVAHIPALSLALVVCVYIPRRVEFNLLILNGLNRKSRLVCVDVV